MMNLMGSYGEDVARAFPDENSFQRLFWEQQLKFHKFKGKTGMKWHPMMIKWCLYMRSKSAKAYDAMKEAGFISLPRSRTLFDYSHCTKTLTGFQDDMLVNEANLLGLHNENWKSYVGLLQDEIRIKSGLVYDRFTGELVGYIDLDKFGNSLQLTAICAHKCFQPGPTGRSFWSLSTQGGVQMTTQLCMM